jgi:hypothetical protein
VVKPTGFCSDNKNPLRDKEERVTLISGLLGSKGWGRNNVFFLENILRWEKKTNSKGRFSDKVMRNEMAVNKAVEAIRLIENPLSIRRKRKSHILLRGILIIITPQKGL